MQYRGGDPERGDRPRSRIRRAAIGGGAKASRTVFTNAPYGIYVEGASHTEVLGNYIGVGPAGNAVAAISNGVRIVDTSTSMAEDNVIVNGVFGVLA